MFNEYRFSGSLPENASTYVTREADTELYESLTAGKFCYVLNSRQSGKSSIRVRTMRRLRDTGVECAAIDLSAGGVQNVTPEQWYVDLIDNLIESFDLDIDLGDWWGKNQLHSEVTRFRKFIEEVLLVEVKENIVIFIDEIDSVLSLKFPTDDFFALIRAFHNQRVDNSDYNRLTFCLLGVASPSNLIQDKQRTPFNIGRGIHLKGFQLHEVEPLRKGLEGKFAEPQAVMEEILNWTGGQPFLTQKLCQFMVEESEKDNPGSVEQVAKARIIENWELQDEPEHLRTIRSRILRDEERAGYLLDLYQQVRSHGEVVNNDSAEQSDLLLSGLVGKQQDKLKVYNLIYQEVFNQSWVEAELKKLRPYSEAFRAWVDSEFIDESRLLRGNALKDAEEWGKDKNLSYQDKQFLAASREKEIQEEIAAREKEAQLERERKDKEATEERNLLLTQANIKAKRKIRNGSIFILLALVVTTTLSIFTEKQINKLASIENEVKTVQKLSQLAGDLRNDNQESASDEALRIAGLSFRIKDRNLKLSMLLASMSRAYQNLGKKNEAKENITESLEYLNQVGNKISADERIQVQLLIRYMINDYQEAFNLIQAYPNEINPFKDNQIITAQDIESIHLELLINQISDSLWLKVEASLKQHHYAELNYLLARKKWQEADEKTALIIRSYLSCSDIKKLDEIWVKHSQGRFGFSVQKKIWLEHANQLSVTQIIKKDKKTFNNFLSQIGWYEQGYEDIINKLRKDGYKKVNAGILPYSLHFGDVVSSFSKSNPFYHYIYDLRQEPLSSAEILFSPKCRLNSLNRQIKFIWPAKGELLISYGMRWGRQHEGIDVANSTGTPIYAAASGVVEKAGWNRGGYGNLVEIRHADGSLTAYGHNSKILVQVGQQVRQGERIALMGSTGFSTEPALHFEIHQAGKGKVNPINFLPSGL